jgi:hypothetical protein
MQLGSPSSADCVSEQRRVVRYPCSARIRAGTRSGVACDMSNIGVAFHTLDPFAPDEEFELCMSFEWTDDQPIQVIHPARVVWISERGRELRVAVEFLD